ncbi:hypothetical protein SAMN04487996_111380 [Dyadobacter soli]|uniref:Uncharacterized protein n=1 Tax=Dyadobacter soli TaxID=659014 RepID=A0A1G7MVD8_9BACT|nr:hypothetical protein [Dyadobacter soli]SDF65657.1 hypothetical protein SAMN04487996_111380 [Dyadobacter soli]
MTKEEKDFLITEAHPYIGHFLPDTETPNVGLVKYKFMGYLENRRGNEYFPVAIIASEDGIQREEDLSYVVQLFKIASKL